MMPEADDEGAELLDDVRLRVDGYEDLYETHGDQDVAYGQDAGSRRQIRAWSESSEETDPMLRKDDASDLVKPLMSPRQRSSKRRPPYHQRRERLLNVLAWRTLYCLLFAAFLALFAYFVVYLVHHFGNQWLLGDNVQGSSVIGCSRIEVEDVWVRGIPKLMTESAFRLLDVNKDGVLDIIFGFATGQ
jgi:hypothetical protein